jgi:hypothetical protein
MCKLEHLMEVTSGKWLYDTYTVYTVHTAIPNSTPQLEIMTILHVHECSLQFF